MSTKISILKSVVLTAAIAASVSGIARADDSSMNPFTGNSYAYFNGGNLPRGDKPVFANAPSSFRQNEPNGLSERQFQAMSSEASAWQPAPVINKAPSSWRESHPNGLSEREYQAMSSEASAWHSPTQSATTALASTNEAAVVKTAAK
jgi:hypothetical protein